MRRLSLAEEWLARHPKDASLLLTLGRLSLRNKLWGKAREYFQSSLASKPTAAAHAELSRLLENLGDTQSAKHHLTQYRKRTADPLPDLPQPSPTPPDNQ